MESRRGPNVVTIMGASGCGKTTVGRRLATAIGWHFLDADDFHPPANIAQMRAGLPLSEAHRTPWLDALRAAIADTVADGAHAVLACSALRQAYRDALASSLMPPAGMRFVYLRASAELLEARLAQRREHFFPVRLLTSQLDTLEEPVDALSLDASLSPDVLVRRVMESLVLDRRVPAPER
ncbi:MAG: gluconokinase [Gemmatimonadaceae bacterium]